MSPSESQRRPLSQQTRSSLCSCRSLRNLFQAPDWLMKINNARQEGCFKMTRLLRALSIRAVAFSLCLALSTGVGLAQASRDVSRESARAVKPWIRDAVIYEVFPRAF